MGSVRARSDSGMLFLDFRYRGERVREQTSLANTSQNRRTCEAFLKRVERAIQDGCFDFGQFFPGSKNAARFSNAPIGFQRVDVVRSSIPEHSTPSFSDFASLWLEEMQVQWRRSHTKNVCNIVHNRLIPYFGDKSMEGIDKTAILAFRGELASGKLGNGKPLTGKTVNANMSVVKQILDEASDRFGFPNPYKNIKRLKQQRSHIQPFSLDEVNRLLAHVRPDYKDYYTVRFYTAMRTGEIDGLKWKYVDFNRRVIQVRETIVDGHMEYTKTDGSQREIPMLGPVYDALKAQHQATGHYEFVFCNRNGAPLEHSNVRKRVWYPTLAALGLAKRRPYQTRHTCATLLLASGENPEWVARLMGHSTTEMLFNIYSQYIPNLTRQDGSAFERLVVSGSAAVEGNRP